MNCVLNAGIFGCFRPYLVWLSSTLTGLFSSRVALNRFLTSRKNLPLVYLRLPRRMRMCGPARGVAEAPFMPRAIVSMKYYYFGSIALELTKPAKESSSLALFMLWPLRHTVTYPQGVVNRPTCVLQPPVGPVQLPICGLSHTIFFKNDYNW